MRTVGTIWKDLTSFGSKKWKLQCPKGILSFRTKKAAKQFHEGMLGKS